MKNSWENWDSNAKRKKKCKTYKVEKKESRSKLWRYSLERKLSNAKSKDKHMNKRSMS